MADTLVFDDAPAFLGGVSTDGDAWATDERPTSIRQKILQLDPNGMTPLTALTAYGNNESVNDPMFSWFQKTMPLRNGACSGIYLEETLTTLVTAASAVGDVRHAKVAEATTAHFRAGQQILLRVGYEPERNKVGKVINVIPNGANSVISFRLLMADAAVDLADVDLVQVSGTVNMEGSTTPSIIGYKPEKFYNYTQIFRTPFQITRTASQTYLRTRDPWISVRQEQLKLHALDIDDSLMWSERLEYLGGAEPERTTRGVVQWIRAEASQNFANFRSSTEAEFVGQSWVDAGPEFLDWNFERLFIWAKEPVAICGTGFLRGINKIARTQGTINVTPGVTRFGVAVTRWDTPYGSVWFKTNPRWSMCEQDRWSCLFLTPEYMKIRVLQDTKLINENGDAVSSGLEGYDGKREEYLTELGLELHHAKAFAYWSGVGLDHEAYVP